ncbi:hypothetical protein PGT21_015096 [Puccinia graminis f. sp. tritici]|uniref:Guanylate kinase-like domain-containing protein n=2 Tax=Puccinia graminis f. sp. tritici TaxID=56615 RepID=A0A5B0M3K9_PUCGR|nr:hypothetical protein PGT21_015096 [Puccinia graminis f. sp. tritici]
MGNPICAKPIASGDINRHLDNDHFELQSSNHSEPKPQPTITAVQSTLNFQRQMAGTPTSDAQNKMTGGAPKTHKRPHATNNLTSLHNEHLSQSQSSSSPSSSDPTSSVLSPSDHRKKSRLNPPSDSFVKSSLPTPSDSDPSNSNKPLAERVRPKTINEFQGQGHLKSALQMIMTSKNSIILWGPSGSGKTTLARCLKDELNRREEEAESSSQKNKKKKYEFFELSATDFSTSEWKKIIDQNHLSSASSNTSNTSGNGSNQKISSFYKSSSSAVPSIPIIFIDEVQRLNKSQQDLFLPYIENGRIIMIFATTENPSFRLTTPLQSRCRLLKLNRHDPEDLKRILERALEIEKKSSLDDVANKVDSQMIDLLANVADGDARVALSNLELILLALKQQPDLGHQQLKEIIGNKFLLYDRNGDNHYELISALHKSVRGGDADAALYWLARMLEGGEDPLYVARRLIRMASEDIGLSNPMAVTQAVSAYQATQLIGMPECDCILAQVVVMLAESPKSVRTYKGYKRAKALVNSLPSYPVPIHLRNAPTKMMNELGYGAEYKYEPDYAHPIYQEFVPPEVIDRGTRQGSSNDVDIISYPFLVPRSIRIDQQSSSSSSDHQRTKADDDDYQNKTGSNHQDYDKSSLQTVTARDTQSLTIDGQLVDLDLLRRWEVKGGCVHL